MSGLLKNTVITALLILALMLSIKSILSNKLSSLPETSHLPDAWMTQVKATILDQQGAPSLKVISPKIVHYAEHDTAEIEQPLVFFYHQSPTPWHIKSRYAKATHGISSILFWDQVTIDHPADRNTAATLIKTTRLTIAPNQKSAQTDQWITLQQPGIAAEGIGMLANLQNGTIHLLSMVKGSYDAS